IHTVSRSNAGDASPGDLQLVCGREAVPAAQMNWNGVEASPRDGIEIPPVPSIISIASESPSRLTRESRGDSGIDPGGTPMSAPIRVGAVSYLNAAPLYYRLDERCARVQLEMDYPSRLADRLGAGDLDVALIPSVEYYRGADLGYEILPGLAIAARGPV